MDESIEQRRHQIERRWPRHQWDDQGRSRWGGWEWGNYISFLIAGLSASSMLLEIALSTDGKKETWLFDWLVQGRAGRTSLLLLILISGWVVDRRLFDRTPQETLVFPWLRWLRRAVAFVPVFGLYAIPAWRWIVRTRPSWAFRTAATPKIDLFKSPRGGFLRRLVSRVDVLRRTWGQSFPAIGLWVIAGQIAPWLALLSWLTTADSLSPGRRRALVELSVLLHGLACALAFQLAAIRSHRMRFQRWRDRIFRSATSLLLLPPFPFSVLGFGLWGNAMGEDESLVGRSFSRRSLPPALALGSRSRARWRPFRRIWEAARFRHTDQSSDIAYFRFGFHRLKIFCLFLDVSALAWLFSTQGRPLLPLQAGPLPPAITYLLAAAVGLLVEGWALMIRLLGWFRRTSLSFPHYGYCFSLTQLILIAGILFGTLLAADNVRTLGSILEAIGMFALAPAALLLVQAGGGPTPRRHRRFFVALSWTLLVFELAVVGVLMEAHPESASPFLHVFKTTLILTPLWSLALFFGLGQWLLHPLRLRHLFDRRLPGRVRAALATVALTAALPLGGLAIPFWIYAQNRLWPQYEPLLWTLERKGDP
jgi:hypothetical protein